LPVFAVVFALFALIIIILVFGCECFDKNWPPKRRALFAKCGKQAGGLDDKISV
jgi:hypothetical protein